jgi:hypothetical protein
MKSAFLLGTTALGLVVACSSTSPSPSHQAGGASNGGQSATGGAGTGAGGSSNTGGAQTSGGASGTGVGGSAGASGAASGASGSGSQSSGLGCVGKAYKLCEDFETGTEGSVPTGWTALKSYGPEGGVGLASDQFHSGKMALKSSAMATGSGRIQKDLAALGATATNHWGRVFYKVQSPAPIGANGAYYHVTFAALEGTTENRVVDTVEDPSGKLQYLFNVPDDSCCSGSSYDWKYDEAWHCAEWHVDVSAESYRFFVDGTEVTSLAFTGNAMAKMSSYTSLALGSIFYVTPTGPFTAWLDDLAIDDQQIGCQ